MRIINKPQQRYGDRRYVLNERILGDTFRLIDEKGEQIGIHTRNEALAISRERGVDLILIAPSAQPPVVKAIDFHKFLYQEEKKNKESRKGQKKSGVKDVMLSLFIGEQDLERFQKKSLEFLEEGYQVRIKLTLKGRELGKKQMAFDLVKRFIGNLGEVMVSSEPKMQGRAIITVVSRKK